MVKSPKGGIARGLNRSPNVSTFKEKRYEEAMSVAKEGAFPLLSGTFGIPHLYRSGGLKTGHICHPPTPAVLDDQTRPSQPRVDQH